MSPPAWKLDRASRTAQRASDCPISLNGIAKGYIVGRAARAALESHGCRGRAAQRGRRLARQPAISPVRSGSRLRGRISESSEPLVFIDVKDRSVATSGSSQRGLRIGGKWYSHVFDPRTGKPVERVSSATVVAPDAVAADVLAKACCVLEPEAACNWSVRFRTWNA